MDHPGHFETLQDHREIMLNRTEKENRMPNFVLLDLDKTVLFEGVDSRESMRTKVFLLNQVAKKLNLCFIPTTQRPANVFTDTSENNIFQELSDLKWYLGNDNGYKCPLYLCELGGVILFRSPDGRLQKTFADPDYERYSNQIKPDLEELIVSEINGGCSLENELVRLEKGTDLQIGIQLTETGRKRPVNDTAELSAKDLVFNRIMELLKSDSRFVPFRDLVVVTAAGDDIDILEKSLYEFGKLYALNAGCDFLRTNETLLAYLKSCGVDVSAQIINSSNLDINNWIVVDDKYNFAGRVANEVFLANGGVVVPSRGDSKMREIAGINRKKSAVANNDRITSLIRAIYEVVLKK